MLAGILSAHPRLMVKRYPHAGSDAVHVGMLEHFVGVGKSGLAVSSAVSWRLVQTAVISNSGSAQGRNVGIAPPAVAQICSDDANTDFIIAIYSSSAVDLTRRSSKEYP
jgi:hypothetical protein